ncbi:MAG: PQQ-binding-like beta-propeller repeat protein, partial [Planctomycetota bacterium]
QLVLVLGLAAIVGLPVAEAENWPQENWPEWRGPQRNGVSAAKGVPLNWSREENVAWRTALPGPAGSTPVLWGKQLFLTTSDGNDLKLQAYSAESGALLWEQLVSGGNRAVLGDEGNYASPSPSTDGQRVVALMGNGKLACYTVAGEPIWDLDIQDRYGRLDLAFGYSSTPILSNGRLYLQIIHGDGRPSTREARVVCLDAKTGDEEWAVERVTGASRECEHAYASPVLYGSGADAQLLTHGADFVVAYDPQDGRELWRLGGMNSPGNYHPTLRFVASPAIGPDLVVVPTAKKGPVFAVRPGGAGDITGTQRVVWSLPRNTPDVPSPLVHDGLVYLCGENGNLMCVEASSGKTVYRKRTVADRHRASPVYADGRVYLSSRGGTVTVVRAGRDFEILASNDLGEELSSSPVIVGDTIFLRTFEALYAIRE